MAKRGTEWLDRQIELLRTHYPNTLTKDLEILIGRDSCSIIHKAHKLKLKKSSEYLASPASGRRQDSPIGTEYINKSGHLVRKINNDYPARDRWKPVHIIEWENYRGPVPQGFNVHFKDGNKKNIDINNLELTSKEDMLQRNTIHRYSNEVKALIRLQHKLERTIKEGNEHA